MATLLYDTGCGSGEFMPGHPPGRPGPYCQSMAAETLCTPAGPQAATGQEDARRSRGAGPGRLGRPTPYPRPHKARRAGGGPATGEI
jgi:hypothetical protein